MNKDGKHQVEHFDDFSSRKVCKVKNLLTVLNCQVIKAKSKWSKLSFFWAKSWKTQKDEKNEKSKNRKKKKNKVPRPGDLCSKSRKKRKFKKPRSRKAEHFLIFREKFHLKGRKVRKSRPFWLFVAFCEKITRKVEKKTKVENFLTSWLFAKSFAIFALCDYRREERLAISYNTWLASCYWWEGAWGSRSFRNNGDGTPQPCACKI